jgi:hypothetical protein
LYFLTFYRSFLIYIFSLIISYLGYSPKSGGCVERILSVPVSLLRDSKYSIWNTLFGILYLEYSIWITCYLEYSHTLLVSPCFTGFTHYLYTMDFPVYLEESITSQSTTKRSTRTVVDLARRYEVKIVEKRGVKERKESREGVISRP